MSAQSEGEVVAVDVRSVSPSGGTAMVSIPKANRLGITNDGDGDSILIEVRITNNKIVISGEIDKPDSLDLSDILPSD